MGSWGVGIQQDDTVLDIMGEFKDFLKETQNIEESTNRLIENNQELIEDDDQGPLFWMALAKCQWDYGVLGNDVLNCVKADFISEKGLDLWKDDKKLYEKRKLAIAEFISKLEKPNLKVKKLPKLIIRKSIFEEGDCLSLKVNDEFYGTALVIRSDHTCIEFGSNLIVTLNYWSKKPPTFDDFTNPQFLKLKHQNGNHEIEKSWYSAYGFRSYKTRIVKIGNINVSSLKDMDSNAYSSWYNLLNFTERIFNGQ